MAAIGESSLVDLVSPRLTNVIQPFTAYVEALGRILRDTLRDPTAWDGRGIITTPELAVRESSVRRPLAATVGG